MSTTLISPPGAALTVYPESPGNVLMLAGPIGVAKHVIFKVAKFDPSKHPKGYKGMFIETPDKTAATNTKPGDVLVTKTGKAFQVEKQTEKGVKVKPVDLDTGEVKSSYTVLGNDVNVGVFQSAKGAGSKSAVSDLEPGTYIKTKAGKRFKISKHGKWTTVYPVDDNGEVNGKHTVLPPDTVVTVDAPSVGSATPAAVKKITEVVAEGGHDEPVKDADVKVGDVFADELGQTAKVVDITPGGNYYEMQPSSAAEGVTYLETPEELALHYTKQGDVLGEVQVGYTVIPQQTHKDVLPPDEVKAYVIDHVMADLKDGGHLASGGAWDKATASDLSYGDEFQLNTAVDAETFQVVIKHVSDGAVIAKIVQGPISEDIGKEQYLVGSTTVYTPPVEQSGPFAEDSAEVIHSGMWATLEGPGLPGDGATFAGEIDNYIDSGTLFPDYDFAAAWDKYAAEAQGTTQEAGVTDSNILHPSDSAELDASAAFKANIAGGLYDALKAADPVAVNAFESKDEFIDQEIVHMNFESAGGYKNYAMDWSGFMVDSEWEQFMHDKWDASMAASLELLKTFKHDQAAKSGLHHEGKAALAELKKIHEDLKGVPPVMDADQQKTWDVVWDTLVKEIPNKPPNEPTLAQIVSSNLFYTINSYDIANNPDSEDGILERIESAAKKPVPQVSPKSEVEQIQEILPVKLPKVPKPYPAGAGENTKVVIQSLNSGYFVIERQDAGGKKLQTLGTADSITAAKKVARQSSADHEPIESADYKYTGLDYSEIAWESQVGGLFMTEMGRTYRLVEVGEAEYNVWAAGGTVKKTVKTLTGIPVWVDPQTKEIKDLGLEAQSTTIKVIPASPVLPIDADVFAANGINQNATEPPKAYWLTSYVPRHVFLDRATELGALESKPDETVRKARPERYTPYLQHDWDASTLVGASVNDALKTLGKVGYREIKPRQKSMVRMINANGKRLNLARSGTTITAVDEPQYSSVAIDGTARQWYDQLQETLTTGGDPSSLGWEQQSAETRSSHTRQFLYDLAVGKKNNVAAKVGKTGAAAGPKVKTDAEYLAEIEAEGIVQSIEQIKDAGLVDMPPLKIKGRGGAVEAFGQNDNPSWDFPNREWDVTHLEQEGAGLDLNEQAALQSLLNKNGITAIARGGDVPFKTYSHVWPGQFSEFKDDPVASAVVMAREVQQWKTDQTGAVSELDEPTRDYLIENFNAALVDAMKRSEARYAEFDQRAENYRLNAVQNLVTARREKEGTVKEAPSSKAEYDLPVWDEIEFQAQSWEDIDQLVSDIGTTPYDVPAFYTGGVVRDGVLQHRANWSYGRVPLEFDSLVMDRLQNAGAVVEENRDPIDPGYQGSAKLYDGVQLTLVDSVAGPETPGPKVGEVRWDEMGWAGRVISMQKTVDGDTVTYQQLGTPVGFGGDPTQLGGPLGSPVTMKASEFEAFKRIQAAPVQGEKRIEYVHHNQAAWNQGGAPTNQRGALRFIGYSPREAAKKAKELGLLGDLEPEVPFKQILRGTRRHGLPAPIHSDYLSGVAPLPKASDRLTHGVTGGGYGQEITTLKKILDSGGLMSIHERHRTGILAATKGTSISGDIRSGLDHCVFMTEDSGGACGSGASVKFVMKPSALLRRDICLAPYDYGGCETRYPQYKSYLNGLQTQAGVLKTNLYEPIDPKVRQKHLDQHHGGSVEYNVGPSVPLEDIDVVGVQDISSIPEIRAKLEAMLAAGKIASMPDIVPMQEATQRANQPLVGG